MQDRDLYARIPGIREPWRVGSVELKLSEGEVHVRLARHEGLAVAMPALRQTVCVVRSSAGAALAASG